MACSFDLDNAAFGSKPDTTANATNYVHSALGVTSGNARLLHDHAAVGHGLRPRAAAPRERQAAAKRLQALR
jgi:hypothetical protein